MPPSIVDSPATECPPPRTADRMPCSRAKLTASTTSAVPEQLHDQIGRAGVHRVEDLADLGVTRIARSEAAPRSCAWSPSRASSDRVAGVPSSVATSALMCASPRLIDGVGVPYPGISRRVKGAASLSGPMYLSSWCAFA